MPDRLMRGHAPTQSANSPASVKTALRQPMALDGKRLNEKKPKKAKATYTNVLNNYEAIRNMVSYPSSTSVEEVPGGKKKVSISV